MKKLMFLLCILVFSVTAPVYSQNVIEVIIQPIRDVKWSSDGEYLAVGQHQGGLAIYDRHLNLLAHIYPQDTISSVSWNPNNTQLAVEHLGQLEILSWDKNTLILESIQVFNSTNPISFVLWNPTTNRVAITEITNTESIIDDLTQVVRTWVTYSVSIRDIQTGEIITRINQQFKTRMEFWHPTDLGKIGYFQPLIWKNDGSQLFLLDIQNNGYYDEVKFTIISSQTWEIEREVPLHEEPLAMSLNPKSQTIAVAFEYGIEEINLLDNYDSIIRNPLYQNFFQTVISWSRDGRFLFSDGRIIDVLNLENNSATDTVIEYFSNNDRRFVFTADWHPYRPIIAIGSLNGRLTVEDATRFEGFTASPIANAGESRIVYVGGDLTADVVLDASASVDYDGTITGYEWREGENVLSTNMIADVNLAIGIHDIQLTVTDDDNLTDSLTIQIEAICKTILATESLSNAISELQNQTEYDTICLESEGQYTLTASLPDITGDITLIGNGAQIVMIGSSRIFNVTATGSLHLKNVTLSGGVADDGGAIYNAGDLNLENVTLQNHSAVRGGAIYNAGSLVMNGGAIQNNSASEFGGGIYNLGDMQLDGVNIRDNTAPEGSGVYQGE